MLVSNANQLKHLFWKRYLVSTELVNKSPLHWIVKDHKIVAGLAPVLQEIPYLLIIYFHVGEPETEEMVLGLLLHEAE